MEKGENQKNETTEFIKFDANIQRGNQGPRIVKRTGCTALCIHNWAASSLQWCEKTAFAFGVPNFWSTPKTPTPAPKRTSIWLSLALKISRPAETGRDRQSSSALPLPLSWRKDLAQSSRERSSIEACACTTRFRKASSAACRAVRSFLCWL